MVIVDPSGGRVALRALRRAYRDHQVIENIFEIGGLDTSGRHTRSTRPPGINEK
jgi:hypothetical protein